MITSATYPTQVKHFHTKAIAAIAALLVVGMAAVVTAAPAVAQEKMTTPAPAETKPNILFIMGDDIGWMQPSIYHRGLALGETPNIDRIGHEGAQVHDLLCRAELHGRANCLHHRHAAGAHRHGSAGNSWKPVLSADWHAQHSPSSYSTLAIPQASSARTIWATIPRRCRRRTASRNTGAICTTSTPCSR